jgi:serine/threonine protein kinase
MIALLGPPPKELLAKSDAMTEFKWPKSIRNEGGKPSRNGREYFEGPFFNKNGEFLYDDLIPARKLEDSIRLLEEEERPVFLSFVKKMLAWLPEDRQTAGELMGHPFLIG